MKWDRVTIAGVAIVLAALLVIALLIISAPKSSATIEVNGQTIPIAPGQTYTLDSVQTTTVYSIGVTVTTRTISLTIWMK